MDYARDCRSRPGSRWRRVQCLMRYCDKQSSLSKAEPGRVRYLPDEGQSKMRDRLCKNKDGIGANEKSHYPQPCYGDAMVGNQRSQIVINDQIAK